MTRSSTRKPKGARLSAASGSQSDAPRREGPPQPYPGHKARQGRIVLDTPLRRAVFFAGIAGIALLAAVFGTLAA